MPENADTKYSVTDPRIRRPLTGSRRPKPWNRQERHRPGRTRRAPTPTQVPHPDAPRTTPDIRERPRSPRTLPSNLVDPVEPWTPRPDPGPCRTPNPGTPRS